MTRIATLLMSTLVLGACATPYVPPVVPPPPSWNGAWGLEVRNMKVHEGDHGVGAVLSESELLLRRTGTILETVQMKNAYGTDLIIPQGTKVFATNYTHVSFAQQQRIDPIEWCALLPKGIDGKQSGSQTVCAFWEAPDRARYIQTYGVDEFPFQQRFSTSGMPGPVPKIEEAPVDFGVRITSQVRVEELDAKGVVLQRVLSDGKSEMLDETRRFDWPTNGPLTYAGQYHVFEVVRSSDPIRVAVRRVSTQATPVKAAEHANVPVARDHGRPCASIASDAEVSGSRVTRPRFTRERPGLSPGYPDAARKRGEHGTLEMLLLVNEQGDVSQVKVLKSTGSPDLDRAGLEITRSWKLAPGTIDGKARCIWQRHSLTWAL
jgi:TonB family protein